MIRSRPAAVAGRFYPSDPCRLAAEVDRYVREAGSGTTCSMKPKAIIAPHAFEHSLEVQLPFLQRTLETFRIVPLVAGLASGEETAELLEALWGGAETLVVVSSDLSHYHEYATAQRLDSATTEAIVRLDPAGLDESSACGYIAVRGLLWVAGRRGLRAEVLDVRSSGDTTGPRDSVVGYGTYAFA